MSEIVAESPLDRLHWLVDGKPTAIEWENLGGAFNPQFHFMALLPGPSLPASEASKVQDYFDAMLDVLAPVRDLIAAYSLSGVMSRAPVSDFSLQVQFSDPYVVDMVRRSLPRALSASAVAHYRRHENTPTTHEAEGSMFFRDKTPQETQDQASAASPPAEATVPAPESPPAAESPFHVTVTPVPAPILPEPVQATLIAAPVPARESGRKRMLVAEGITIQGGDILGCAHLAIEGEAYSTIDRCEKLEILPGGIFKGTASVAEAEISGYCTGTLVVKGTLRITGTGHVVGSIQYGRLQVEDGGRIEGEMKIPGKSSESQAQKASDNPRWLELDAKVSAA
jgi:cytoskeletal protein CcmA (bactofilin family)